MMKTVIDIQGMENASSADNLKKALEMIPGVQQVDMDFETQEAQVEHDESQVKAEEFVSIIERSGYKASTACP